MPSTFTLDSCNEFDLRICATKPRCRRKCGQGGMIDISAVSGPRVIMTVIEQEIPMAALPFNDTWIEELVLQFKAVMAKEGTDIFDLGCNASDDAVAVTLQEAWEQTKAFARQQHEGLVLPYLLGQPEAEEFLTTGLEKMVEHGLD
jgi:hypothetical protein